MYWHRFDALMRGHHFCGMRRGHGHPAELIVPSFFGGTSKFSCIAKVKGGRVGLALVRRVGIALAGPGEFALAFPRPLLPAEATAA
jgi:hypothetical protein